MTRSGVVDIGRPRGLVATRRAFVGLTAALLTATTLTVLAVNSASAAPPGGKDVTATLFKSRPAPPLCSRAPGGPARRSW